MILAKEVFLNDINSPVRHVKGRVELYKGSTLLDTFNSSDRLKSFTVERTSDGSKLFGYGVCQKLTASLRDKERAINIDKSHTLEAVFGTGSDYVYTTPLFYVSDVKRNENTNEVTVTAYDALYRAASHTVAELDVTLPYSVGEFVTACAAFLGLPWQTQNVNDGSFDVLFDVGANFDGTETLREALDAAAEATQTIYFIDANWELTFKRLDVNGAPVVTIDKSKYFSLENKGRVHLSAVCHATELGDNVIAGDDSGVTQYIRNNPFWELRGDIGALVQSALAAVNGLCLHQFICSWRGNYLLELGDKIALVNKDDTTITSYLLDDKLTYNGALSQQTEWIYEQDEGSGENASNPATLGDALKMTYARVDKANQQIDLVASRVDNNADAISQLTVNAEEISASVSRVEKQAQERIDGVDEELGELTKRVDATMTAEDITFAIQSELNNGVEKVVTSTGFVFNEDGLTVSKTGREMSTRITEDGMRIYRSGNEVLTVDNVGVKAENLHATTYLIIGLNSRFEDYDGNRTGCFWIGG